ncbi:MAG: cation-translocating P-type ATPase [Armatimonadota bacterium]|nr:cation-translocating P-type ATPase [Armatimonadota bacterium]MDR7551066.1 cation-translocating P-type ATPase [Armatimonadota bacterium]
MTTTVRREIPIAGMDCADCALKIERALQRVGGVEQARVSLGAERATVVFDPARTSLAALARTIEDLGYRVSGGPEASARPPLPDIVSGLFVVAVAAAVLGGLAAERLGWVEAASRLVPAPVAVAAVLVGGFPIFRRVALALRARTVTPHALMTLGIAGALAIGEYGAAAVIVVFMRFADFLDAYAAGRARAAIRELVALQPLEARVGRDGQETMVPAAQIRPGEIVLVKPGERIPTDGVVVSGRASVNQAPITGESVPVERGPGQAVLAATINLDGVLRVRAEHVGPDSTFGRIVRLVEEAEAYKSRAQRFADRVTAYYIPIVAAVAAGTWLLGGSATAAVAVLVVSCSCGIALATPVAVIAAVGRAARGGILVKGGTALEALARADAILLDKTGTLTLGRPRVTEVCPADGRDAGEVLAAAAAAERYSEHPIAAAITAAAGTAAPHRPASAAGWPDGSPISGGQAADVQVAPGQGVVLREAARQIAVGSRRFIEDQGFEVAEAMDRRARDLEAQGQTVVYVAEDRAVIGLVAVADAPRPEVPEALEQLRRLGIRQFTMLTGDNARVARAIAQPLGIDFQADLLPQDKIAVVRRLQRQGRVVAMVGDGINDAPALAQSDVGIAMGAATGAAIEAADVALLRDDWRLVPGAVRIGRRAFAVIRQNLLGAVAYNVVGIALAASGVLPPIFAAAAQVVPDVFILLNSGRLLRAGRAV